MGALIRRIGVATSPREARAAVEDDFHHFRVIISHDGARVTATHWQALRRPWSACALAGGRLSELAGMALSPRANAVIEQSNPRQQCTHMFDLAGLAIAAAARNIRERRYEAVVPDRVNGKTEPCVSRDGVPILHWSLDGGLLTSPPPFGGQSLHAGFARWVDCTLDLDDAEAALVLRRAVFISGGRGVDLDAISHAPARGGCFVQQPERAASATRMRGSTRDFSSAMDPPLASDQDWLAGKDERGSPGAG